MPCHGENEPADFIAVFARNCSAKITGRPDVSAVALFRKIASGNKLASGFSTAAAVGLFCKDHPIGGLRSSKRSTASPAGFAVYRTVDSITFSIRSSFGKVARAVRSAGGGFVS